MILYILAGLAILQTLWTLRDTMRASHYIRTFRPRRNTNERVVVFCPCKGTDAHFEKNILSILDQDYPNYGVQFIVESETDSAFDVLRVLGAKVMVAGKATSRGQKVHNLAHAVKRTTDARIFVFCDSDARFPRTWLSTLIAPLNTSNITTGYRWYVAGRFHFPTLLRSAWNVSSLSVLGDHNRNFAWGGSTAIFSDTFSRLKILEAWRGSVSDDYSITRAAQRAKTPIVFVPECLIPSYGECSFREVLEFTTRQILITRVYHPALWRIGFAGHVIFNSAFWLLAFFHPWLCAALYALSALRSWIRYVGLRTVVVPADLSRHAWFYILSSPLLGLLYLYNMIASALGNEIVWRKIRYKLISPDETQVLRGSGANDA